jgi:hypothetical protein
VKNIGFIGVLSIFYYLKIGFGENEGQRTHPKTQNTPTLPTLLPLYVYRGLLWVFKTPQKAHKRPMIPPFLYLK